MESRKFKMSDNPGCIHCQIQIKTTLRTRFLCATVAGGIQRVGGESRPRGKDGNGSQQFATEQWQLV